MMGPGWYLRRLSRMGPAEVVGRARHAVVQRQWRSTLPTPPDWPSHPRFTARHPPAAAPYLFTASIAYWLHDG